MQVNRSSRKSKRRSSREQRRSRSRATSLVGHEMRRSKLHFLWLSPRGCLRCFAAFEFILLPGSGFLPWRIPVRFLSGNSQLSYSPSHTCLTPVLPPQQPAANAFADCGLHDHRYVLWPLAKCARILLKEGETGKGGGGSEEARACACVELPTRLLALRLAVPF